LRGNLFDVGDKLDGGDGIAVVPGHHTLGIAHLQQRQSALRFITLIGVVDDRHALRSWLLYLHLAPSGPGGRLLPVFGMVSCGPHPHGRG
jgi:hypothetical protein